MEVGHCVEEGTEGSWVLTEFFFEIMVGDSKGADGDGLWHIDSSVSICIDKARHAQGHGVLSGATDMVAEDDAGNILLSCQVTILASRFLLGGSHGWPVGDCCRHRPRPLGRAL